MVFGCSVSFSLMINCFSTTCLFSIGTCISERIEKYTFIDAQIPNCTINGHSSSTGKTSVAKSTKVSSNHFSAEKLTKQYPLPNLYLKGRLSNESSTKRKPPTARNEIPCKKRKSREFLKCLKPEEGNEVQNSPDIENKEPRTDFQDFSKLQGRRLLGKGRKGKFLKQSNFLAWTGIRQAIPPNLKCLEFNENDLNSLEFQRGEKRLNPLTSRSKHLYELLILRKARISRGFIEWKEKFCLDDTAVSKAFLNVRSISSETFIRSFQFKILNDITFTNYRLAKISCLKWPVNIL